MKPSKRKKPLGNTAIINYHLLCINCVPATEGEGLSRLPQILTVTKTLVFSYRSHLGLGVRV